MSFDVSLERLPVIFADRNVFAVTYKNPTFHVAPDTLQVDDVGTVDPHEHFRRQGRFHVLEPEKRGDRRAVGKVHPHVLPFAFQVHDVADLDQRNLVIRFTEMYSLSLGSASGVASGSPARWLWRSS